jgi:hypothetical protein
MDLQTMDCTTDRSQWIDQPQNLCGTSKVHPRWMQISKVSLREINSQKKLTRTAGSARTHSETAVSLFEFF